MSGFRDKPLNATKLSDRLKIARLGNSGKPNSNINQSISPVSSFKNTHCGSTATGSCSQNSPVRGSYDTKPYLLSCVQNNCTPNRKSPWTELNRKENKNIANNRLKNIRRSLVDNKSENHSSQATDLTIHVKNDLFKESNFNDRVDDNPSDDSFRSPLLVGRKRAHSPEHQTTPEDKRFKISSSPPNPKNRTSLPISNKDVVSRLAKKIIRVSDDGDFSIPQNIPSQSSTCGSDNLKSHVICQLAMSMKKQTEKVTSPLDKNVSETSSSLVPQFSRSLKRANEESISQAYGNPNAEKMAKLEDITKFLTPSPGRSWTRQTNVISKSAPEPYSGSTRNIANDRLNRIRKSIANTSSLEVSPEKKSDVSIVKKSPRAQKELLDESINIDYNNEVQQSTEKIDVKQEEDISSQEGFDEIYDLTSNSVTVFESMEWNGYKTVDDNSTKVDVQTSICSLLPPTINEEQQEKSKDICIVVDTNILLGYLRVIKDIVNMTVSGSEKPILFIPWMVFTELDYIKEGSSENGIAKSAQDAIRYINSLLNAESCRIKGQTVFEANEQISVGKTPDDKIIACCLQAMKCYEKVILLSNDLNAKNKALVNGINACSHREILIRVRSLMFNSKKFQRIQHKMNLMCSYLIMQLADDAFGPVWQQMELLKKRPWSLKDCMKIFKKYWISMLSDKLMKQFLQAVDDLLKLLESNTCMDDGSEGFKKFADVCAAVCFFFKDIEKFRLTVEKTIHDIREIKKS